MGRPATLPLMSHRQTSIDPMAAKLAVAWAVAQVAVLAGIILIHNYLFLVIIIL